MFVKGAPICPKKNGKRLNTKSKIFNYLRQSHISNRNVSHLRKLAVSPNQKIAELAGIVLEVAEIKPYKKKKLPELARNRRDLLQKLEEAGLILANEW